MQKYHIKIAAISFVFTLISILIAVIIMIKENYIEVKNLSIHSSEEEPKGLIVAFELVNNTGQEIFLPSFPSQGVAIDMPISYLKIYEIGKDEKIPVKIYTDSRATLAPVRPSEIKSIIIRVPSHPAFGPGRSYLFTLDQIFTLKLTL